MDTELKNNIIKHASELFFQFGPSKVTMEEVAERLGMSKKTLYKAFASKDDLLSAVVEDFQCGMDDMMKPAMEATFSADEEGFTAIIAGMSERVATTIGRTAHSPLFKDLQRSYPKIWAELEERRSQNIIKVFRQILDNGSKRGVFRPELHHQLFIDIYVNAIGYMMNPNTLDALSLTAGEAYRMMITTFFMGALTDKGRTVAETFLTSMHEIEAAAQMTPKTASNGQNGSLKNSAQRPANGFDASVDDHFTIHGLVEII
jgi:AcrR family transcriptional regulator